MSPPFYIVGLGNPGSEYLFTRHNAGFMVLDILQREYGGSFKRSYTVPAHIAKTVIGDQDVELVKPRTFMNRSGIALRSLNLSRNEDNVPENLLVVFDDIHLPLGAIRYRYKGSHGGHNGVRSIIDSLGTNQFYRLRIGIGGDVPVQTMHDYVLGNFNKSELDVLSCTLNLALESIAWFMEHGIESAMNKFNSKVV